MQQTERPRLVRCSVTGCPCAAALSFLPEPIACSVWNCSRGLFSAAVLLAFPWPSPWMATAIPAAVSTVVPCSLPRPLPTFVQVVSRLLIHLTDACMSVHMCVCIHVHECAHLSTGARVCVCECVPERACVWWRPTVIVSDPLALTPRRPLRAAPPASRGSGTDSVSVSPSVLPALARALESLWPSCLPPVCPPHQSQGLFAALPHPVTQDLLPTLYSTNERRNVPEIPTQP